VAIRLQFVPLPALTDNYIWLLHDGTDALAVDPGNADVVRRALAERQLTLRGILLTHHHDDHVGGVAGLLADQPLPVYAPDDERIHFAGKRTLHDGDALAVTLPSARFVVIGVPAHTRSHIAYYGEGALFCGDTLFSLGCGRLFEGSAEQMLAALDRLSHLPGDTLVCAGHEYTAANGRFAQTVDPDNATLRERLDEVARLRARDMPTLPVTLQRELRSNPFLRVDSAAVGQWCRREHGIDGDRVACFAALRAAKDRFH
jgi:hydroxyacylglutathione hydrolase